MSNELPKGRLSQYNLAVWCTLPREISGGYSWRRGRDAMPLLCVL